MPIIKSAVKRMRQTAKRRERNVGIKKDIKGAVKAFVAEPSAKNLSKAQSELDKTAKISSLFPVNLTPMAVFNYNNQAIPRYGIYDLYKTNSFSPLLIELYIKNIQRMLY